YGSQRTALAPRPWMPLTDNYAEPVPTWVAHPSMKGCVAIADFYLNNHRCVIYKPLRDPSVPGLF
ncbi:MAG: hypothetical protein NTY64_22715, partial [Deltaproteobacteria bacterium]|nr:hypothetical protein [Deltaproteobacteria bacterium]